MSKSTELARLRNRYRHLSPEDLARLADGDPNITAQIKQGEASAADTQAWAFTRQWVHDNLTRYFCYFLVAVPLHLFWAVFIPKPPWTRAFLHWLFGVDTP